MDKWKGKVALISGASAGLGNHLCRLLVKYGMTVIGIARKLKDIEATAEELKHEPGKLVGYQFDFLDCEKKIDDLFNYIEKNFGGISLLVNMASTSNIESLIDDNIELFEHAIEINIMAPAILCQYAIKNMIKYRINGQIINVGGTASYYTSFFNDFHYYSVSKFALRAIGDALRMEFRAKNINIRLMHIGPGHILTGAQDRILKYAPTAGKMRIDQLKNAFIMYNGESNKFPNKLKIEVAGENVYHNNILPALKMQDVNDYILKAMQLPQSCEITDIIMKPTDRMCTLLESNFYKSS